MLEEQLSRWVERGLITIEQADAIRLAEEAEPGQPGPVEPGVAAEAAPSRTKRRSVAAEVVGSLGAIAAAAAAVIGTAVLWEDLTSLARIAIPIIGAVVLLAAGAAVPREDDASTRRLGALLWLFGIAATGAAVAIAAIEEGDWDAQNVLLVTGLVVVALTLLLTPFRREPHLALALAGGLVLVATGLVAQYDHATAGQFGVVLVALGIAFMLFGWAGRLASTAVGYLAGGAIAFVGTEMLSDAARHWPVVVGLSIAVAALAAFVVVRHRALLAVGLANAIVFLVQGIILASDRDEPGRRGGTGVVFVAFGIGIVLLAGALYAMRAGRHGRTGGSGHG